MFFGLLFPVLMNHSSVYLWYWCKQQKVAWFALVFVIYQTLV